MVIVKLIIIIIYEFLQSVTLLSLSSYIVHFQMWNVGIFFCQNSRACACMSEKETLKSIEY